MLSIVLSYYRQPKALEWQLEQLAAFEAEEIELVLVDDGSNDGVPAERLAKSALKSTLVTIQQDIPWNIPEARNWGMVFARGDFVFRSDIDHRPTQETLTTLLQLQSERGIAWTFRRVDESQNEIHRHTDTFLLSKADYWEIGGYDERLSGSYGSNAQDFISRAEGKVSITPSDLIIETRQDFSSQTVGRDVRANKRKLKRRNRNPRNQLLHLSNSVRVQFFNHGA